MFTKYRHDQSLGVMDIYTPTKCYDLIWLCFQDMSVESEEEEEEEEKEEEEEEEEEEDEHNSLS